MKKLMMIAAVAACAVQAQAATTWTATIELGTEYKGYSVWTVNCWNKYTHNPESNPGYYNETAPVVGMFSTQNFAQLLDDNENNPDAQKALWTDPNMIQKDYGPISGAYKALQNLVVNDSGTFSISSNDSNEMYSWLFVIASSATPDYGTEYAVVRAHEYEIKDEGYTGGGVTKSGNTYTYKTGDYTLSGDNIEFVTSGTIAIPEPTSGLLLLLGMAGLALKRKRA